MFLDNGAESLDLAILGADAVYALQSPVPDIALQGVLSAALSGIQNVAAYPHDSVNLGWGFGRWQGRLVVVIQGVQVPGHATGYVNALNEEINWNLYGGANTYVLSQAERILFALRDLGFGRNARTVIFGHSMGGAVALALNIMIAERGDSASISTITYGAPRPGPDTFASLIQPLDVVRWMNGADSVPLIPPRQNQAPAFFAAATMRMRQNANRYVQPHGGIVIDQDGTAADRDVPEIAIEDIQSSLSLWLYSCYLGVNSVHSIPAYILALGRRAALPSQQRPATDGTSSAGQPVERNHSGVIDRAVNEQINLIKQRAIEQDAVPLRIPEKWQVRARKVGGVWGVYWHEVLVAIGPQKGRCRKIAHSMNLALRRLQQFGFVGADDLATTFQQYMDAARAVDSGFQPVMRSD